MCILRNEDGTVNGMDEGSFEQQFASDNYAGICPEAWQAMEAANRGHVTSYGDDPWTAQAADAFRSLFETECEVYFVFNGTAANSLALASLCQSYHSVICCDQAHVETDECGAPEFFSNGSKLLVAASAEGKLTPHADSRAGDQAQRHSLSQAASCDDYAGDGNRARVHAQELDAFG